MTTGTPIANKFEFRDEYLLGEYILVINEPVGEAADNLAGKIRSYIESEFKKANPILCEVYDFVIEEVEVWQGSRKSRNKAKLKKKKGHSFSERVKIALSRFLIVYSFAATNPEEIKNNYDRVVNLVEDTFNVKGNNIRIDTQETYPLDSPVDGGQKNHFDDTNVT